MTEAVSEDAAAARAADQVRLRKQRREAKIKAGGASRLDRITGLGGGMPKGPHIAHPLPFVNRANPRHVSPALPTESPSSSPAATPTPASADPLSLPKPTITPATAAAASDIHADPDEVDISQHFYAPQSTARMSQNDPSNLSEAQLRQMMLGFDPAAAGAPPPRGSPAPAPGMEGMEGMSEDPMMQMLQKMMAGGMPGAGGPGGANPFAGTGLESLLGGMAGGGPNPMQQQQGQQTEQDKKFNLWRVLHAIFALGLGIYVALSTTFTGTKIERDTDDLQGTGLLGAQNLDQARVWFFYVFTSVETVLLTSRYMIERGAGFTPSGWTWTVSGMLPDPVRRYSRHALRYAHIFTTVRNDALFCIFVLGICHLLRA
ncbi:hypothetical protein F4808DRAFT_251204 [Astrocystis sublimbata]|nr:hypothetical protein F4808DRAFT_251204 [Astrocystis sublimbata]